MDNTDDRRGPKERAYDEHIAPLMERIIAVCKEHRINTAATFMLDLDEDTGAITRCTTVLPVDKSDEEGHEHVMKLRALMYPPPPMFAAFTIMGGK